MNKASLLSIGALFVLPTAAFAEIPSSTADGSHQQILIERIESLEKEIQNQQDQLQVLKSLIRKDPATESNSSSKLASSKDFEADFAGSYIGLGIGSGQFTGSSDASVSCDPVCLDDVTYYPSEYVSLYDDLEQPSTSGSENFISLELGNNWSIGDYIVGIKGAFQYGKGEILTASFQDIADFDARSQARPGGDPGNPGNWQEKNTLTITPSDFKSELSVLVGRPFGRMMPYLYAGIEGRQFTSELDHYYHDGYRDAFSIAVGNVKEKDFSFAPVVGAGLSYAVSPKLQLDWKAGWSFHELHTAINSHTLTEFNTNGVFSSSTSWDESTTSTKTYLTEFQVGIGVKYFF